MSSNQKTAFITGITGQVGSYMAEFLLEKKYKVYGLIKRNSVGNRQRIKHLYSDGFNDNNLFYGDILDMNSIISALDKVRPDEIYHYAAMGHTGISYAAPVLTMEIILSGTTNLLNAVRALNLRSKIFNASSVEIFDGSPENNPLIENSKYNPSNPYGAAKLAALKLCNIYRQGYGMFIS
ncbi:MAG: GDP-mannose 4,6-dehydratase, partial [Promethearchaeota archaeon]